MPLNPHPAPERRRRFAMVVILFLAPGGMPGCGCSHPIPPPADRISDPVELIHRMSARLDEVQSARFRVVSEVYGDDIRGANLRQVVLVRQPADLHIQVLSPFDQTMSILVSNGQEMALYDMENHIYYHGEPSARNISLLLPFHMTAPDIASVILGGPPRELLHPDVERHELSWDDEQGAYHLRAPLHSGEGVLDLWIRHGDWLLETARCLDEQGERVFELRAGEFEEVQGVLLPSRLRFLLDGEEPVDMSLRLESAELNVSLVDSLFVLEPPRGVEQVDLDAVSGP